jgi:CBS domain containing-hemolysin-like protein
MILLAGAFGACVLVLSLLLVALLKINMFAWSGLREGKAPFRLTLPALRVLLLLLLLGMWTPFVGLLTRIIPWDWGYTVLLLWGAALVLHLTWIWAVSEEGAENVVGGAMPFFTLLDRLFGAVFPGREEDGEDPGPADEPTDTDLKTYIDVGMEQGILEEGEEARMLESLLDFSDTLVREVMTPRTDMVTVSAGQSFEEVLEVFVQSHFSRLPVTGKSLDDITGIVYVKDFVRTLGVQPRPMIPELLRPPILAPETKKVRDLLREMREGRHGMAIVVDEYGGTAGLVTLEDLLEEIVGEIEDEQGIPPIMEVAKGKWSIAGKVHIEDLSEALGLSLENPEVDTVAGLLIAQLGRIPKSGDVVQVSGAEFTVETADDRRVYRVLVRKLGGA